MALPDGPAYFTSRGSVMGQVHGPVVAAAFAVFNPAVVVPAVAYGWTLTDATTIAAARDEGAIAQLCRILGDEPAGLHRAVQLLLRRRRAAAPGGQALCSQGSRRWPCPSRRWAWPGGWPTCCASTGVTRTSRRGRAPASTLRRSGC